MRGNPKYPLFLAPMVEKISKKLLILEVLLYHLLRNAILLQPVLSNLPTYYLFTFTTPTSFCNVTDKIMRDFLWEGAKKKKGILSLNDGISSLCWRKKVGLVLIKSKYLPLHCSVSGFDVILRKKIACGESLAMLNTGHHSLTLFQTPVNTLAQSRHGSILVSFKVKCSTIYFGRSTVVRWALFWFHCWTPNGSPQNKAHR